MIKIHDGRANEYTCARFSVCMCTCLFACVCLGVLGSDTLRTGDKTTSPTRLALFPTGESGCVGGTKKEIKSDSFRITSEIAKTKIERQRGLLLGQVSTVFSSYFPVIKIFLEKYEVE